MITPEEFMKIGDNVIKCNTFVEDMDNKIYYVPEKWKEKLKESSNKVAEGLLEVSLIFANIYVEQENEENGEASNT